MVIPMDMSMDDGKLWAWIEDFRTTPSSTAIQRVPPPPAVSQANAAAGK
jgi:hypothetical protein